MGKVSKHMKHKGIFLVDLKKALDEEKSAKWLDNEKHEAAAQKTLDAYIAKYDTSKKSPLK